MVALAIFWAALLAIILFVFGSTFKTLASIFNGLLDAIATTFAFTFLAGLACAFFYMLFVIGEGIRKDGLGSVIGTIVMLIILLGLVGGIIGGLGAMLLEVAYLVGVYILIAISFILEGGASICEKGYLYFLRIIVNKIDKC